MRRLSNYSYLVFEMEDNNVGNLNAEHDDKHTVEYWKQRALHTEKLLEASLQREYGHHQKEGRKETILVNLQESVNEAIMTVIAGLWDIIGKTDLEVFNGGGVKEFQKFKKEVLERGIPDKREITYTTELFGSKTFLMYVEPVFSNAGEKNGINYTGMEITDQVKKREKMIKLREKIAVQKARESELH
nr:histidine kinase 5 [Tanacetum cinerariifolium]